MRQAEGREQARKSLMKYRSSKRLSNGKMHMASGNGCLKHKKKDEFCMSIFYHPNAAIAPSALLVLFLHFGKGLALAPNELAHVLLLQM